MKNNLIIVKFNSTHEKNFGVEMFRKLNEATLMRKKRV